MGYFDKLGGLKPGPGDGGGESGGQQSGIGRGRGGGLTEAGFCEFGFVCTWQLVMQSTRFAGSETPLQSQVCASARDSDARSTTELSRNLQRNKVKLTRPCTR